MILNSPAATQATPSLLLLSTTLLPPLRLLRWRPPWSSKSVFSDHDNVILSASATATGASIRKVTRSNSCRVRDESYLFFFPGSELPECIEATATSSAIELVVSSLLVLRSLVVIPDGCATNGLLLLANKVTNVHMTTMTTATTMTTTQTSMATTERKILLFWPPRRSYWRRGKAVGKQGRGVATRAFTGRAPTRVLG